MSEGAPLENTKEHPGPLDAFETLKPGERHFTLQELHPLTPPAIHFWVSLARFEGLMLRDEGKDEAADELLLRATKAEELAWDFEFTQKGWKQQHEHDERHEGETREDAKWRLSHFNIRTHVISKLHNSIAETNDQVENLKKLDPAGEDAAVGAAAKQIIDALAHLRVAAQLLTPARHQ